MEYARPRGLSGLAWTCKPRVFHTWNVKRLRPKPLGPFNYESENYTKSLWISEGITSYYDDLLLVRAGLMNEDEYLKRLSKQLERFQNKPGRTIRSLEDVSFDAWIKHYKRMPIVSTQP